MSLSLTLTNKTNIVLIGGKAFAGKTLAANYLMSKFPSSLNLYKTSFASPIKEIATKEFGWDGIKDEKGRRLLQVIGTDAGRDYNKNIWVKKAEDRINSTVFPRNFVFIDDWRFPNERDYWYDNFFYEVTTVGINRPNFRLDDKLSTHPSETSIDFSDKTAFDFHILNDGTVEDFYNKLIPIINHLMYKVETFTFEEA